MSDLGGGGRALVRSVLVAAVGPARSGSVVVPVSVVGPTSVFGPVDRSWVHRDRDRDGPGSTDSDSVVFTPLLKKCPSAT